MLSRLDHVFLNGTNDFAMVVMTLKLKNVLVAYAPQKLTTIFQKSMISYEK